MHLFIDIRAEICKRKRGVIRKTDPCHIEKTDPHLFQVYFIRITYSFSVKREIRHTQYTLIEEVMAHLGGILRSLVYFFLRVSITLDRLANKFILSFDFFFFVYLHSRVNAKKGTAVLVFDAESSNKEIGTLINFH